MRREAMTTEKILSVLYPLLKIKSVKSAPEDGAPFGKGVKEALEYCLNLAESMGFKTKNYDNYIGEVICGEGEPFGILCHLDVVPEGSLSAWNSDPFTPTIKEGKLFCRGVLDDKSPAISALLALYELKEQGYKFKREVKLILGCDEESGWGCIDHYKSCATLPEEGFSPDAEFPVIYSEKGILHSKFRFKKQKMFSANGGIKANVVCDEACAKGDFTNAEKTEKIELNGSIARATGVAAHGSTPEKGDNAIKYITEFLETNGFVEKGLADRLFGSCEGAKDLCDETGHLTFSPNIIATDNNYVYYVVDIRYPATLRRDFVESALTKIGEFEVLSYQKPLYADKNSELVQTLMGVYKEVTGDDAEPIAIGGGTYARALKSAVAFGPSLGEEEGSSIHMPNEFITLETLQKMTEIYYLAIKKLCTK